MEHPFSTASSRTHRRPHRLLNYLLCTALFCGGADGYGEVVELSDEFLLITAVSAERTQLSDAFFVYYKPEFTLVPLQSLCDVLSFSITVDPQRETASGWFFDESNTFNLDLQQRSLFIRGEAVAVSPSVITANDGFDIYLNVPEVEQWLGIKLELVPSQLLVKVKSERPLPILEKLRREKSREITTAGVGGKRVADIQNHYRFASYPVADLQATAIADDTENNYTYSVEASADLFWHQMNLALNGDKVADSNTARILFSRRAPDFGLTLGAGLSAYAFGDVYSSGDALINKGSSGVGVTLDRQLTEDYETQFTNKIIEGDAPPGWEVELYRNGVLIDFQISDREGRYRFANAPLQFGENVFDIKLYGPQGQQRNRRERVNIGPGMIKPNEWNFHASILRENDNLIGDGATAPVRDNVDMMLNYGVSKSHSLGLGWARSAFSSTQEEHDYLRATWLSAWPLASTRWDVARDVDGGTAHNLGLSTRLFGQEYSLEYTGFNDFVSQRNPGGTVKSITKLLWSGQYSTQSENTIPVNINIEDTQLQDGSRRYLVKGLVSYGWDGFRINSESVYNRAPAAADSLIGSLNFSYNNQKWRTRSNLTYDVKPEAQANKLANTVDWRLGEWSYQLRLDVGLQEQVPHAAGFNLSRQFRFGTLSLSANYAQNNDYDVQFSYEYSLGAQRGGPYVFGTPTRLSDKGRVRARVFLDNNDNGDFDETIDQPLAGIKFSGRKEWDGRQSDADGYIELRSFNPYSHSSLTLDETSLNDPFLRAAKSSLLIAHHAGGYYEVTFPVGKITDIEGYAYLVRNGERQAASGVTLRLLDEAGETVDQVRAEFDGYYYFTGVSSGRYQLALDQRIQTNADYRVNTPIAITATSHSSVVNVPDIVIHAAGP